MGCCPASADTSPGTLNDARSTRPDVDPAVARPLIDGVKNSVVVTDTRIQDILPRDRRRFEAAVADALGDEPATTPTPKARLGRLFRGSKP